MSISGEVHLSYMPLAHVFERLAFHFMTALGAQIGYSQGEVDRLVNDIQTLRPTSFTGVPRLVNKIYDKVMNGLQAKSKFAQRLFHHAYQTKLSSLQRTGTVEHFLWDRLVFKKIRMLLGGRVRVMLIGSAPLSPEVWNFLKVALSCQLSQGYGMTEACAFAYAVPELRPVCGLRACCRLCMTTQRRARSASPMPASR
jgi:long-chain acyl-CoA synthetase